VSKSRAKKKQRRRSRAASSSQAPAARQERAEQRATARGPDAARARPPVATHAREPEEAAPTRSPPAKRRRRPQAVAQAQRRPSRLEVRDGVARPDAIWAPFPLTEIGMAVGLVLFVLGFASSAPALFAAGVGVLVVVVAELCLREHLSGFRSHSILLGLLPVTAVHLGVVYLADATWRGPLALAIDLAVAGALAWLLQRRFVIAQGSARAAVR
jgi:hypothetical protein